MSSIDVEESCGGTGVLNCFCAGDFCACGYPEIECGGCEDCGEFDEDYDDEYE